VHDGSAVTVVIPTHNRPGLLLRTLDSVLHQKNVPVDVVVVDDGGAARAADAIAGRGLDHVRVIRHERSRGVSAARNAGLKTVRTPWVAFVDDDDLWAPTKLDAQLAALSGTPKARWSCVDAVHVDEALQVVSQNRVSTSDDVHANIVRINSVPGGGSGLLVDSELARDVGGFDEDISILADWDFNLRLSVRSPVAVVHELLVAYFVHSDSMYHDPAGVLRELRYLERKHAELPDGRSFRFPRGPWYANLALMSRLLRDNRAAAGFLLRALPYTATAPMRQGDPPAAHLDAESGSPALVARRRGSGGVAPALRALLSRLAARAS
jgi:glycosyltransferase involved in cell wall biosynthesis